MHRNEIQKIIKFLRKRKLSITYEFENWYRVGYAIANTFTQNIGEKYYLNLCEMDGNKFDKEASINLLRYCYENTRKQISFGTIKHLCKLVGYKYEIKGESVRE